MALLKGEALSTKWKDVNRDGNINEGSNTQGGGVKGFKRNKHCDSGGNG